MSDGKPTLEQVREVIAAMMEASDTGWIGEGDEIAQDLLNYIDGKDSHSDWWLQRKWDTPRRSRNPNWEQGFI